jgi:Tfp pilus assembly protein PilF
MVLLLMVSLVTNRKYFQAGRFLYSGERLLEQGRYEEAKQRLQQVVELAPASDKAVLLMARAALLSGDVDAAQRAFQGHNQGRFEDVDDEYREVESLWNRAISALEKANQASTLAKDPSKEAEAAALMHDAATTYPELPSLALAAEYLDESVAFERKDYDAFLSIAEDLWRKNPAADTCAAVASALAAKYAVTGDPSFRKRAEEMLE